MKIQSSSLASATIVFFCCAAFGQDFVNLDFEESTVTASDSVIVPGWSVLPSDQVSPHIFYYDTISLAQVAEMAIIMDNKATFDIPPIQGNYSVLLNNPFPNLNMTISIGQTATLPPTAQSLTFSSIVYAGEGLKVSFNGQNIPYSNIGDAGSAEIYGADISNYAGQTGELLFTLPGSSDALLDNIQMSSTPVPEPSALIMIGVCILFFWRLNRRSNNSPEQTPIGAVSPHSRLTDSAARLSFCR
jgi:PEP-CTERM motif